MRFHIRVGEEALLHLTEAALDHGQKHAGDFDVIARSRGSGGLAATVNRQASRNVAHRYSVALNKKSIKRFKYGKQKLYHLQN